MKNNIQNYYALWTGRGAQLACDIPFSAICWSTLEPVRRRLLSLVGGEKAKAATILGANFSAGFVADSFAAAATCRLDVAKTRRQIEKDPIRALRMTTRQTLIGYLLLNPLLILKNYKLFSVSLLSMELIDLTE